MHFGVLHLFDRKVPTVFVSNITLMGDEVHGCFKVNGNVDDGPDDYDTVDDGMADDDTVACLLYTSPSPRDGLLSRMPSSA